MTARGRHHRAAFLDVVRQRLLHIHVFARLTGEHGWNGVPMIGRCDPHGVQVLLFEQSAKILVLLRQRASPFFRSRQVRRIQITHGDELDVRRLAHESGHEHPAAAATDQTHTHSVVRAGYSIGGQSARRNHGAGLHDAFDELSSFHVSHLRARVFENISGAGADTKKAPGM